MRTIHRYLCLVIASIAPALPGTDAIAQTSMHVTPVELVQLPRLCWAQLQVPDATGDDFRIRDCGPSANHYCSALIYILRAKGHVNKRGRFDLLSSADIDLRYTEGSIAPYPKCSIREHVQGTRVELEQLMKLYGYNRPRAK
jgi:hypothetical protein